MLDIYLELVFYNQDAQGIPVQKDLHKSSNSIKDH